MAGESMQPLNEFITLQRGFDLPAGDRLSGSVPVVAATGVAGVHNESKVKAPGVVIGRSGSIGGGQYVSSDFWPLNTTLWVKDFKGHNERFVYYLLKSIDFSVFNVGSGVPTLNRNHLSSVQVTVKPRSEQDRIAEILGALDDKIELNCQLNETLEAMAQALYKSWFVDFDPVIDNALAAGSEIPEPLQARAATRQAIGDQRKPLPPEIQSQFPTSFVFTDEMGWIPEGWDFSTYGDLVQPKKGKNITKKTVLPGDVPVVAGGLTPAYFHNESNVKGPVITISASGANAGFVNLYSEDIWASDCSYISKLQTNDVYTHYLFLKSQQTEITRMQQGAAQPHVYPRDLERLKFVNPGQSLLSELELIVSPMFQSVALASEQTESLSNLRDVLLPKLLSGELRVSNAEQKVAEAL